MHGRLPGQKNDFRDAEAIAEAVSGDHELMGSWSPPLHLYGALCYNLLTTQVRMFAGEH